jgi:murein DD-endopeptidase MepM/ murein hydrolase activator NlpD
MRNVAAQLFKHEEARSTERLRESKYYAYLYESYDAVLAAYVGEYEKDGKTGYGLRAYSPIAAGFAYSHYDDFGAARGFGFKRKHLGNDIMGSVGTPIIAVESGTVEELGWNMYGGWRVGVRSFDGKRYYYYAHMRKDRPYHPSVKKGGAVIAGDVIGYLGMTGYSRKENVNKAGKPHLHFGIQLIFDESQRKGAKEIWIDTRQLIIMLDKHRSPVAYDKSAKEYFVR